MAVSDATLPLQAAVVAALKANAAVAAIVGTRIYDNPAGDAAKPYISIGPSDLVPDDADGIEAAEITMQIDGWSDTPTSVQVKQVGAAIRAALHHAELTLPDDQRLVFLEADNTRYLTEPDGLTRHVAVSLRALTEPIA